MQQGGLARAVGSDETYDAASRQRERAVCQRPAPAVALAESNCLKGGGHATPSEKQSRNDVR